MLNNFCEHCGVSVSPDLKYCPLCGKFVLDNEHKEVKEGKNSFPQYDFSYIYRAKWLKIVKQVLVFVAFMCCLINLRFITSVYWFPYVWASLFVFWFVIFKPFNEGENHIKRIPASGFVISLMLVFIDVYDYFCLHTALGWAITFAAPSVLTGTVILSFILSLSVPKSDVQLIKGIIYLEIISVIFLIVKIFAFKQFATWPAFMFFLANTVSIFLLFVSRKRRIIKEINRTFHL